MQKMGLGMILDNDLEYLDHRYPNRRASERNYLGHDSWYRIH